MRIIAGDVREGIVSVVIRVLEVDSAIDFQAHFAALGEARQLSIILRREFETRKFWRLADVIAVTFAMHQSTLGARHLHQRHRAFLRQKRIQIRSEAIALDALSAGGGVKRRLFVFIQLGYFDVGQTLERCLAIVLGRRRPGDQHNFARQFALPFREIALIRHRRHDDRCAQYPVCRRRPRERDCAQLQGPGGDHPHMRGLDPPTPPKIKALGSDVLQAPALEFLLSPALRFAHGRRVGHAAAYLIGQIGRGVDDLAMVESGVGDPIDRDGFRGYGSLGWRRDGGHR